MFKYYLRNDNQVTTISFDKDPDLNSGFIWIDGVRREIKDIHHTKNGTQIEVF